MPCVPVIQLTQKGGCKTARAGYTTHPKGGCKTAQRATAVGMSGRAAVGKSGSSGSARGGQLIYLQHFARQSDHNRR